VGCSLLGIFPSLAQHCGSWGSGSISYPHRDEFIPVNRHVCIKERDEKVPSFTSLFSLSLLHVSQEFLEEIKLIIVNLTACYKWDCTTLHGNFFLLTVYYPTQAREGCAWERRRNNLTFSSPFIFSKA
jgi:hypothetical protein